MQIEKAGVTFHIETEKRCQRQMLQWETDDRARGRANEPYRTEAVAFRFSGP